MSRAARKAFKAQMAARRAALEEACGDKEICAQCHATLATCADVCSAGLDAACEGFVTIDRFLYPENYQGKAQ